MQRRLQNSLQFAVNLSIGVHLCICALILILMSQVSHRFLDKMNTISQHLEITNGKSNPKTQHRLSTPTNPNALKATQVTPNLKSLLKASRSVGTSNQFFDLYLTELREQIVSELQLSPSRLRQAKNLKPVYLKLEIQSNGLLQNLLIHESSGNAEIDTIIAEATRSIAPFKQFNTREMGLEKISVVVPISVK